jgi:hypothetical protein
VAEQLHYMRQVGGSIPSLPTGHLHKFYVYILTSGSRNESHLFCFGYRFHSSYSEALKAILIRIHRYSHLAEWLEDAEFARIVLERNR